MLFKVACTLVWICCLVAVVACCVTVCPMTCNCCVVHEPFERHVKSSPVLVVPPLPVTPVFRSTRATCCSTIATTCRATRTACPTIIVWHAVTAQDACPLRHRVDLCHAGASVLQRLSQRCGFVHINAGAAAVQTARIDGLISKRPHIDLAGNPCRSVDGGARFTSRLRSRVCGGGGRSHGRYGIVGKNIAVTLKENRNKTKSQTKK